VNRLQGLSAVCLALALVLLAGPVIAADSDGDGLRDGFERRYGVSSPHAADTDGDGVIDSAEDSDGDRLSDKGEQRFGTDPTNPDTDGDGIADSAEDDDGDGRSNAREQDERPVPRSLKPALAVARDDMSPKRVACQTWHGYSKITACEFGDLDSDTHIVLAGDSHATVYITPLRRIAEEQGWHLTTMNKGACPAFPGLFGDNQWEIDKGRSCLRWQERVMKRLEGEPVDLVVFAHAPSYKLRRADGKPVASWRRAGEWRRGLKRTVERLPKETGVLALGGTPRNFHGHPVSCLARNSQNISACVSRRQPEEMRFTDVGLKEAASVSRAQFDSLFDKICSYDPCPIIQGDVLMYRDSHHLSETFARQLQPSLEQVLLKALANHAAAVGSATVGDRLEPRPARPRTASADTAGPDTDG
jgi:hypothetical protein